MHERIGYGSHRFRALLEAYRLCDTHACYHPGDMFDTHAHVHAETYDGDRDEMLARARAAGIERIMTIGTDLPDSARAQRIALSCGLDYTIGIHPHETIDAPADIAAAFDALVAGAQRPPRAIGEMGLDYYYDHSPRDVQRAVLAAQLRYALAAGYPAVFHQRDAFDDFVATLRDHATPALRGVVHCFTGDAAQARMLVAEFGLRLGIGGVVTFKTADNVREAVRAVGVDAIVLETDCPYLAPIPHRGRRNEPAYMAATAAFVAELLGLGVGELTARTSATAAALFGA
jgi:TatD DNase family protein